jgi:hypothetical protein
MKPFLNLLLFSFFTINLSAQNTNDVTLTVVGSGKTIEEAKTNALRSAIEQAYGAFVSSNTEILNDEIVKDEIVSISSGNIKEFKILSQSELMENLVSMTLSATVSVSKLQSYAQSKGATVEFAGGTFAMNMKLQKLNEDAETAALKNLCAVLDELYKKCFDFKIKASEPLLVAEDRYKIEYIITSTSNSNYPAIIELIYSTLKDISMSDKEMDSYTAVGKKVYLVGWFKNEFENPQSWDNDGYNKHSFSINEDFLYQLAGTKEVFAFRSLISISFFRDHFISSNSAPFSFSIMINGLEHVLPSSVESDRSIALIRKPETSVGKLELYNALRENKILWAINDEFGNQENMGEAHRKYKTGFPDARIISSGYSQRAIGNANSFTAVPLWTEYTNLTSTCSNIIDCNPTKNNRWLEYRNPLANSVEPKVYSIIISDKASYTFTSTCVEFLTLSELEKISEITVEPIYK